MSVCNILQKKTKCRNLSSKVSVFRIFRLEVESNIVISEISTLGLSNCKIWQKKKRSKFETKNVLFGYFWFRFFKNYFHIWNKNPQVYRFPKFCKETKMLKSGTKNVCLEYFWTETSKCFGIFAMELEKNIGIFEICTLEFRSWQKNKNAQIMN